MEEKWNDRIETYLEQMLARGTGHLGVCYEDLASGRRVLVLKGQDEDVFEAASVIKIWIMSAVFEKVEKGILRWDQEILLTEKDMVPEPGISDYRAYKEQGLLGGDMFPESGVLNYLHPGLLLTLRDLVHLMIIVSDNTATNMLIDLLGIEEINQHIRSLGFQRTVLARKLFDCRPGFAGHENMFSLEEAAEFFRRMYMGVKWPEEAPEDCLVSVSASQEMCAVLQNQQTTYKIPFYIQSIPIAHKTGEDLGIVNDVGIVFTSRPFSLCFAGNKCNEPETVRLIQEIARDIVRFHQEW